jgi:hypothetical protein
LRTPADLSFLNAVLNTCRFIDDILSGGITIDRNLLNDSFLFEHFYPRSIFHADTNQFIPNPFILTVANQGRSLPYLDMSIALSPYIPPQPSTFQTSLYNKLDHLLVIPHHLRFPHFQSKISNRVKFNVLYAQLIRFARLHSQPRQFVINAIRLIVDMYDAGYPLHLLRSTFCNFQSRYATIYMQIFGLLLSKRVVRSVWRFALFRLRIRVTFRRH